jgi:hypothetical protein
LLHRIDYSTTNSLCKARFEIDRDSDSQLIAKAHLALQRQVLRQPSWVEGDMHELCLDISGEFSLEVVEYLQSQSEGSNKASSLRLCSFI